MEEIENIILSFTEFTVNHKFNIGYPREEIMACLDQRT